MLLIKPGCNCTGLQPEIFFAAGLATLAFARRGHDCVITAGLDGDHNPGSLHARGLAVDIRNENLSSDDFDDVLGELRYLERFGFDVVNEHAGQTGKTTAQHFHVEYQPKPGERQKIFS